MADYNQRCADVFGSLSLPQSSSLSQASSLKPEEGFPSNSGSKEEFVGQSVREGPSRNGPHNSSGDCSNGQAVAMVHSGGRRRSPEGKRRYAGGRDEGEEDCRGAVVGSGGRRGSAVQGRRGEGEGRYRGGGGKRHRGRGHRATPDYMAHPQHWTKYDLGDDRATDSVCEMSEEQRNTFAALQFLEDLRARNRGQGKNEDCLDEEESSGGAVVFRKPVVPSRPKTVEDEIGAVKGTWNHARILPEYQVGSKPARKRKPIPASLTPFEEESISSHDINCDGMQLRHLCETCEDEEQSCDSHMTLGKDPKQALQDVESVSDSSEFNEPPKAASPQLPSHCEGEQQEGKLLFKKSGKRKKQGQKRVSDAELD